MRSLLAIVPLAAACGATLPQPELERFDIRITPVASDHPDVPAVVLLDRGTLYMTIDPKRGVPLGRLRRYRRVKVLRPAGTHLREIAVPYNPGEAVYGLIARSVSPEGEGWSADLEEMKDEEDAAGRRRKRLSVPKIDAGWVVEHTYDLYIQDLRFIDPWSFQADIPTKRSEFAVVVPKGFEVDVRYSEAGAFQARPPERFDTPEGTRFFWSASDLPARFEEPSSPMRAVMIPRAHVIFQKATLTKETYVGFSAWDDVGKWFLGRVPDWSTLSEATVAEARRVAGDTADDEKALKIHAVIAKDLGWDDHRTTPLWRAPLPHPEEALREKRGNRTSRGLLLVALLRAAGLNAVPALVAERTEDFIAPDAPTAANLTGVVAVVSRPSGPMVLDPSQLTVSGEVPSPKLQGTRMVMLHGDVSEVVKVPISLPEHSTSEIVYTLELDARTDLFGTVEARFTGAEAGQLREALLDAKPEDYSAVASTFLRSRGAGLAVDSVNIRDLGELRRPLSLDGKVTLTGAVEGQGTELFLRIGRLIGGPDETLREVRKSPLVLGAPSSVDVVARITLPEDHEPVEALPAVSEAWTGGQVDISMRQETRRRVSLHRVEKRTALEVEPNGYPEYRRFREGVRVAEDQVLGIRRPAPRQLEF
jgi:hypothetical protein